MPAAAGALFEAAFRRALPAQVRAQPELLLQLVKLLSPRVLQRFNVPLFRTAQRKGDFIITFPGIYYGGFSHGVHVHLFIGLCEPRLVYAVIWTHTAPFKVGTTVLPLSIPPL